MILKPIRIDASDLFLVAVGVCLIGLFAQISGPNLYAIFAGTHREMALPDGARVLLAPWMTGQVDAARREIDPNAGQTGMASLVGWARNPRAPAERLVIKVYYDTVLLGLTQTAAPSEPGGRNGQPPYAITVTLPPGFKPSVPFRVFAVTEDDQAVEIFRGAAPAFLADDAPPKKPDGAIK
jgi:hypothetical protein